MQPGAVGLVMSGLWQWVLCALAVSGTAGTNRELTGTEGRLLHADETNFTKKDFRKQQQQQQGLPGGSFILRVQVSDMLTGRPLSKAAVELFVNHTLRSAAVGSDGGEARLRVPFHAGLPVTVASSKQGFISALLLWETSRKPVFSSVTLSLLPLTPGNIWLFDDSVLITSRTAVSQATVRFPQRLLNLTHGGNLTAIRSYLTVPRLTSDQGDSLNTLGIVSSKSGFVSVALSPVVAVSVRLFSGDVELNVSGPIQISLNVPQSRGLQESDVVPAWFFSRTTGGWMRKGLGKMMLVDGKLMWTFTAPHLGHWIAAPLTSSRGSFGLQTLVDFILQHLFFLVVLVGGTLVVIVCLLFGLLCYCRRNFSQIKPRQTAAVVRKDQTTCTDEEESETSGQNQNQSNGFCVPAKSSDVIANPSAVVVSLDGNKLDFGGATLEHRTPDGLFFYNQPVAILPAPAFFHLEEHPAQSDWSRSATLPRASNGAAAEPQRKESFTQTLQTEEQLRTADGSEPASRTTFGLPESASVPGTLNKLAGSRHSVHAVTSLSKVASPQPPRAWFVSLEGKPAAEIRYAGSEQQRRRRTMESRETSLDSGVDLSELNQTTGRRVTLERNATFIKNPTNKNTQQ
ncbi:protein FAM171B-like isoform X2 [Poeciliopsis prolifica]|uniref:protein FAM171B-like isoform X2 n=1 Tax=Poeciliopsis prolifica TaxID=188132 RepID=UPI002413B45F|nr:protein FAM171B-like isoform X2 [Poeciliopsis prolifica]